MTEQGMNGLWIFLGALPVATALLWAVLALIERHDDAKFEAQLKELKELNKLEPARS